MTSSGIQLIFRSEIDLSFSKKFGKFLFFIGQCVYIFLFFVGRQQKHIIVPPFGNQFWCFLSTTASKSFFLASVLVFFPMNNWEGWSHFLGRQQIFYFNDSFQNSVLQRLPWRPEGFVKSVRCDRLLLIKSQGPILSFFKPL